MCMCWSHYVTTFLFQMIPCRRVLSWTILWIMLLPRQKTVGIKLESSWRLTWQHWMHTRHSPVIQCGVIPKCLLSGRRQTRYHTHGLPLSRLSSQTQWVKKTLQAVFVNGWQTVNDLYTLQQCTHLQQTITLHISVIRLFNSCYKSYCSSHLLSTTF